MEKQETRCGGIEDYQWIIVLIFEALVRVITAFLDKDKPSEPQEDAAAETTINNHKETNDD